MWKEDGRKSILLSACFWNRRGFFNKALVLRTRSAALSAYRIQEYLPREFVEGSALCICFSGGKAAKTKH